MPILHRLSLCQKFIILGIVALLTTALPTGMYFKQTLAEINTARLEAQGTAPVIALQRVVQLTQQHRGITEGMLGGNELLAARRPETLVALGKAMEALDASLETSVASRQITSQWAERKQRWAALEHAVASRQLKPAESFAQHTQLIVELLALNADVLDEFGLSLDPQSDSYALVMGAFVNTPGLAEKLGQMRARGAGYLVTGTLSPEGRAVLTAEQGRAEEILGEMMRNLGKATAANAEVRAELAAKADTLKVRIAQTLAMADQGLIKATKPAPPSNAYFQEFTNTIDRVYEFNAVASQSLVNLLDMRVQDLRQALHLVLGVLVSALVASVVLSLAVMRSIAMPVQEALQVARAVAQGDLTVTAPVRGSNEIGQLMQALKAMQENLAMVVGNVRRNSESVATASAQIAQGNNDLSSRTEQQASALEETAASMEQLSSTVGQNADNARQANQLAMRATTVAVTGGEVVGRVVGTMKEINDSSKKIADIINVIDGIAFQTNILALNAAVEAARAGEQGRGFAVVATEVRNLAGRSAHAAKEIKRMITASVERVEQGTALVDRAGVTMIEIVTSIKRVTDLMGEISSASAEQSAGVAQVSEAVGQMDHATQQNAALVEQSAAAAESLKVQARQLVQAVAVFKLGQGIVHTEPAAALTYAAIERRGACRATNVTRPRFGAQVSRAAPIATVPVEGRVPALVRTGTDDWESF